MSCRIFTDQADIACIYQSPSAVRCWASRMKGEPHLTISKNRLWDEFSCLWRTASNELIVFWYGHCPAGWGWGEGLLPPSYSSLSRMGKIIGVLLGIKCSISIVCGVWAILGYILAGFLYPRRCGFIQDCCWFGGIQLLKKCVHSYQVCCNDKHYPARLRVCMLRMYTTYESSSKNHLFHVVARTVHMVYITGNT